MRTQPTGAGATTAIAVAAGDDDEAVPATTSTSIYLAHSLHKTHLYMYFILISLEFKFYYLRKM